MKKYLAKPVEIEAIQWDGTNKMGLELTNLKCPIFMKMISDNPNSNPTTYKLTDFIETPEGEMTISNGDWIIRGTIGEWYPCKDEVFKKKYEEVRNDQT